MESRIGIGHGQARTMRRRSGYCDCHRLARAGLGTVAGGGRARRQSGGTVQRRQISGGYTACAALAGDRREGVRPGQFEDREFRLQPRHAQREPRQLRGRLGTVSARAGDLRESARTRPSRRRRCGGQHRQPLHGARPLRRCRAALPALAGDSAEGARARPSRRGELADATWLASTATSPAIPMPNSSTSNRWRSARRCAHPAISAPPTRRITQWD